MKILVTGGAGYIGSHVVRQLTEAGYTVVVVDDLSTGSADALIHGEELIVADLADRDAVRALFDQHAFTAVLHFAASIVAPESIIDPVKYYANNTCTTVNLLDACTRFKVKQFIFSSTALVYGPSETGVFSENSPTVPINPYGTSKLMSEWILRDAGLAHDLRAVVLRYFNVAGADPLARMGQRSPVATHLLKVSCQAALGMRKSVVLHGSDYPTPDGTCVRDYIHVEDLATAHRAALRHLEQGGQSLTLNVGYGTGSSVREVVGMVREVSGSEFAVESGPRRPGDPAMLVAKTDRIRELLHWRPQHAELRTIVADALRWEKKLAALARK